MYLPFPFPFVSFPFTFIFCHICFSCPFNISTLFMPLCTKTRPHGRQNTGGRQGYLDKISRNTFCPILPSVLPCIQLQQRTQSLQCAIRAFFAGMCTVWLKTFRHFLLRKAFVFTACICLCTPTHWYLRLVEDKHDPSTIRTVFCPLHARRWNLQYSFIHERDRYCQEQCFLWFRSFQSWPASKAGICSVSPSKIQRQHRCFGVTYGRDTAQLAARPHVRGLGGMSTFLELVDSTQ